MVKPVKKQVCVMVLSAAIVLVLASTGYAGALNAPSIVWSKNFSGSGLLEVDSLLQTADSGFLLAGTTSSGTAQPTYIELVKVDASGNIEWNKTYEGVGNHFTKWLIPTSDGNYAIAGEALAEKPSQTGFWLTKIDQTGNIKWTKTYLGDGLSYAVSLVQTSDGGYALTGQTNLTPTSSAGSFSIWLVKTDASGNQQWAKTVGAGTVNSIIQTSDNGFALTGYAEDGSNSDFLLIKTSPTGEVQWNKTYGSQDKDFAASVVQTSDDGYALGGSMWQRSIGGLSVAIVKTDNQGNTQWTQYYGAGKTGEMIQTANGDFVLANDPLVKVDSSGNELWELSLGTLNGQVDAVIQTQDGGYTIGGWTSTSSGNVNAWLAKVSSTQTPNPTNQVPETQPWTIAILYGAATTSLIAFKFRSKKG